MPRTVGCQGRLGYANGEALIRVQKAQAQRPLRKNAKILFVVDLDADTTEEEDEDVDDLDWSEEA